MATTFSVNDPGDAGDSEPGDGVCATARGVCTLRAAVDEANVAPARVVLPAGKYQLHAPLMISGGVEIAGAGLDSTLIHGARTRNAFEVQAGGTLQLSDVTVGYTRETGSAEGGCIVNDGSLNLTRVQVKQCRSWRGGGLLNRGSAQIENSVFYGNHCVPSHGSTADGGGAAIFNASGAVLDVSGSFFAYNRARSIAHLNVGCPWDASGGGALHNDGTATLVNSTFWHNRSRRSCGGFVLNLGTLTATNVTASENHAAFGSGGLVNRGTATLVNTIIANSRTSVGSGNCFGAPPISLGHNLETGSMCEFTGAGDLSNADPDLHHPAANGGATPTMALLPGSPAIDAGEAAACPPTDERGDPRQPGAPCCIGAYEVEPGAR